MNTVRFVDPGLSLSSSLYATGLEFSGTDYALTVKNISPESIQLSGRAFFSGVSNTQTSPASLKSVLIAPGDVASVRLEESVGTSLLKVVALELSSSGPPGSIVSSLSILYPNAPTLSASIPFRDVSTEEQATGGYPWRIDGDYTTHAYLTNASSKERSVVIQLLTESHQPFVLGTRTLKPGETQIYNVRDIRDKKIPDVLGHVLPSNVTSGQFVWAIDTTRDIGGGLLGRTVMESKSDSTLRSYSCFSCTCGYAIGYITLNQYQFNLSTDNTATVTTTGYYQSPCASTQVPPPTQVYPQFGSYNTSVVYVGGTTIEALNVGQTEFVASYYSNVVTIDQGCSYTNEQLTADGNVTVTQPAPTIVVNVTGSKSPADSQLFSNADEKECSESLGPQNCTAYLPWNIEFHATVPDDASYWIATVTLNSARVKGTEVYPDNSVEDFDTGVLPSQQDGPQTEQANSGSKDVFYLDGPGYIRVQPDGGTADSYTLVQNFTAQLCSNRTQACYTYDYYVKQVVDTGQVRNMGASSAGPGQVSTDF